MKLINQIIESYKLAFLFLVLVLPLFLVPVFAEGLQHYAEYKLGMFALKEGDTFGDKKQAIRVGFGVIKLISILFVFLVLPRFFLNDQNRHKALSFSADNIVSIYKSLFVTVIFIIWIFFIGPRVLSFLIPSLSPTKVMLLSLLTPVFFGLFLIKSTNNWIARLWGLALPTAAEHKAIFRAIYGSGVIVQIAVILPAMGLHYWLGYQAMGQSVVRLTSILLVDAVVVGILANLIASVSYVLIRDAYTDQTANSPTIAQGTK